MLLIVLVVLFTLTMALWAYQMPGRDGWVAWCAVLILGIVVFLSGWGLIAWQRGGM